MTEKPILFSAPMVLALLAGRKTQTRRALKEPYGTMELTCSGWKPIHTKIVPGDVLWVRETWTARMTHGWTIADARSRMYQEEILYKADGANSIDGWWSSIYMPREFSRITLKVTNVRVQRLRDISREDAIAEGIVEDDGSEPDIFYLPGSSRISGVNAPKGRMYIGQHSDPRLVYRDLINNLHKGNLWDENPWVAAYSFDVHQCNISKMVEAAA